MAKEDSTRRSVGLALLVLVLGVALFNLIVIRSSNTAPDDAYISLRYARNLAHGEGFRFNPGGERVEGFSSPLHVLTMAVLIKGGLDPLRVSQLTSLAAAFLTILAVTWWGHRKWGLLWGTLGGLAVGLHPGLSTWARGGLETTGFALLIALVLIAAAEGRWRLAAIPAGLLAITRPEGVLYWLPLVAFAALMIRRQGRPWRDLLPPVAISLALSLPWLLFRWAYFGDLLPNTYYAKMDGVRSAQIERGLSYLSDFAGSSEVHAPLGLIFLAALVAIVRARRGSESVVWWPLLAAGFMTCTVVFVLSAGGDWMSHHRFLIPAVPMVMILAAAAGHFLSGLVSRSGRRALLTGILAVLFLSQPIRIFSHDLRHPNPPRDRPLGLIEPWDDTIVPQLYQFGERMGEIMAPTETFALVPVGAPAFASDRIIIDMLGLNDREIGHLPMPEMGTGQMGHEKGNSRVVLDRRPDYIMLRHNPNPDVDRIAPPDGELKYAPIRQLWNSAEFRDRYEPFLVRINEKRSFTIYRRVRDRGSS